MLHMRFGSAITQCTVCDLALQLGGVEATQKLMEETGMTTVVPAFVAISTCVPSLRSNVAGGGRPSMGGQFRVESVSRTCGESSQGERAEGSGKGLLFFMVSVVQDVAIAMQALSDGEQDMADKVLAAMDPQWVLEKVTMDGRCHCGMLSVQWCVAGTMVNHLRAFWWHDRMQGDVLKHLPASHNTTLIVNLIASYIMQSGAQAYAVRCSPCDVL